MKREHKFRDVRKNKKTGEITFYYYTLDDLWEEDSWQGEVNYLVIATDQFTGLKDKNGVEIYEGDKVEGLDFENHIVVEGVFFDSVQWHPFAGQRALRNVEVIGNIHE